MASPLTEAEVAIMAMFLLVYLLGGFPIPLWLGMRLLSWIPKRN